MFIVEETKLGRKEREIHERGECWMNGGPTGGHREEGVPSTAQRRVQPWAEGRTSLPRS